jgi:hypothetical protein
LVINFKDDPEGRKEEITVEISDTSGSARETFAHVERIVFPKEKLANLHGKVQIRVQRNGWFNLAHHAHGGGYLSTEYMLAPIKTRLLD